MWNVNGERAVRSDEAVGEYGGEEEDRQRTSRPKINKGGLESSLSTSDSADRSKIWYSTEAIYNI